VLTGQAAAGGAYFGGDFLPFLRELARNNNRAWFQANKRRYESGVRDAGLRFVREAGPLLTSLSRHLVADPRPVGGSMTRIYRDIRFSKDKSPYKTGIGIHFFHDAMGLKEEHLPGFYLHLEPRESVVAAGIWQPEPPALQKIRSAIVGRSPAWAKVRAAGFTLGGESLKRVPPGFDAEHRYADDLRRKDFVASLPLTDREVASAAFAPTFVDRCRTLEPLNAFLAKAVGVAW
jgi:uncharacterized protein (TIGR02453 family)